MFLTPDELRTFTGLRRPSAQIRWLRSRRVKHYVNGVGHPVVARAWIVGTETAPTPIERARPDLRIVGGGR